MFERESKTWRRLNHQNILPLIGLTYQFGPIPFLITPWMDEGPLTDFIYRNHSQLTMERKLIIVGYLSLLTRGSYLPLNYSFMR